MRGRRRRGINGDSFDFPSQLVANEFYRLRNIVSGLLKRPWRDDFPIADATRDTTCVFSRNMKRRQRASGSDNAERQPFANRTRDIDADKD